MSSKQRRPASTTLLCASIVLAIWGLTGCGATGGGGRDIALMVQMRALCAGTSAGVPKAAEYVPGPGRHPMLANKKYSPTDSYLELAPFDLAPKATRDAQLVACIDLGTMILEQCSYFVNGQPVEIARVRYQATIRLLAARSGQLVATETLYGSSPVECPAIKIGAVDISGSHVTDAQVQSWLQRYAQP